MQYNSCSFSFSLLEALSNELYESPVLVANCYKLCDKYTFSSSFFFFFLLFNILLICFATHHWNQICLAYKKFKKRNKGNLDYETLHVR